MYPRRRRRPGPEPRLELPEPWSITTGYSNAPHGARPSRRVVGTPQKASRPRRSASFHREVRHRARPHPAAPVTSGTPRYAEAGPAELQGCHSYIRPPSTSGHAGQERGVLGQQGCDRTGDLVGGADAAHRDHRVPFPLDRHAGRVGDRPGMRRLEPARKRTYFTPAGHPK
jgi:hypothetical protein